MRVHCLIFKYHWDIKTFGAFSNQRIIIVASVIPGLIVNKTDAFDAALCGRGNEGKYFIALHAVTLSGSQNAHENNYDIK